MKFRFTVCRCAWRMDGTESHSSVFQRSRPTEAAHRSRPDTAHGTIPQLRDVRRGVINIKSRPDGLTDLDDLKAISTTKSLR